MSLKLVPWYEVFVDEYAVFGRASFIEVLDSFNIIKQIVYRGRFSVAGKHIQSRVFTPACVWITLIVLGSVLMTPLIPIDIVSPAVGDFLCGFQLSCSACQRSSALRPVLVNVDFILSVAVAQSVSCPDHFVTHIDSIELYNEYTMSVATLWPSLCILLASYNVLWCN